MSKRMTKMEACHHLTVIRDELVRDRDRMRERVKSANDADPLNSADTKRYVLEKITENDRQIRALEMAGAALTR